MRAVLGIDIGSMSVKIAALGEDRILRASIYQKTAGMPVTAVFRALREIREKIKEQGIHIAGVGVTGSGRELAALLVGADLVQNEVTALTIAALHYEPRVSSVIEIGGQDSKAIILKNGIPVWHNLNALCAAGTGSFLEAQAHRLQIPVEKFGDYAARSKIKVTIASKCGIFSESDMIHKAAIGYSKEDIIKGLCEGLVRNFVGGVTKNRQLCSPTIFAGGVASNTGVVRAFEEALGYPLIVPREHKNMGSIGTALLVLERQISHTRFRGFEAADDGKVKLEPFMCEDCPNQCEITRVIVNGSTEGYLNSRCGKYRQTASTSATANPVLKHQICV